MLTLHTFLAMLLLFGSAAFLVRGVVAGPGERLSPSAVFSPGGKSGITAKDYAMTNQRDYSPAGYSIKRLNPETVEALAADLPDEERRRFPRPAP